MLLPVLVVMTLSVTVPAQADLYPFCAAANTGTLNTAHKVKYNHDIPAGQAETTFTIPDMIDTKRGAIATACDADVSPEVQVDLGKAFVRRHGDLSTPAVLTVDVFTD